MILTPASGATARADLMGHTRDYRRVDPSHFNALIFFPPVIVDKPSGDFVKVGAKNFTAVESAKRGAGGDYPRSNLRIEEDTFKAREYGHEVYIDNSVATRFRNYVSFENIAAEKTTGVVMREFEGEVKDLLENETNYPPNGTTGKTVSVPWDNVSATPAADIAELLTYMQLEFGVDRSQIVLSVTLKIFNALAFVTDVRTRLKIDSAALPGSIPATSLAIYFGVGRVEILHSVVDLNDEGQSFSPGVQWSDDYAHLHIPGTATLNDGSMAEPRLGATFIWAEDVAPEAAQQLIGSSFGIAPMITESYAKPEQRGTIVRSRGWMGAKEINPRAHKLIKNTAT